MNINVTEIDYHRNGISGNGSHVCKFTNLKDGKTLNMLGVVFSEPGSVAVFNLDLLGKGEIRFFYNSWRGDNFEYDLREAIKNHQGNPPEYYDFTPAPVIAPANPPAPEATDRPLFFANGDVDEAGAGDGRELEEIF